MKRLLLSSAAFCLSFAPAFAQSELGTPVTATLIPGWKTTQGVQMAALDLQLEPGWKTYWRVPGDAGIPPRFDWSGSRNLAGIDVIWPTPEVTYQNGMQTIGYKDRLVIPLRIAPKRAGRQVAINLQMDLGICSDICVPYTLKVSGPLDNETTRPTPAIVAALAQQPYTASEAGVKAATCTLTPHADGLSIRAKITMPSLGRNEAMVIEAGQPGVWVSEADTRRSGRTLTATADMAKPSGGSFALNRSAIRMTVIAQGSSVEIEGCSAG